MKKIFILFFVVALTQLKAQITWTGAGTTNDFSEAANWTGSVVPGSTDVVIFDGTSGKNCDFDFDINVHDFSVTAAYTGTIDGLATNPSLNGNFSLAGGTFISTSGPLAMNDGNGFFVVSGGGVFIHNGGSIDVNSQFGQVFTFSGNVVLKTLNLLPVFSTTTSRTIDFGTNLAVDDIVLNGTSNRIYAFQGTAHVKNSLNLGNASHTTISPTNSGTFIFDGTSASIIGSTSTGAGKAYLPNIEINTTGNYSMTRSINLIGTWTGTQGTLTPSASTVNLYGTAISGTASAFNTLNINTGASVTFPPNEVFIAGDFVKVGSMSFPTSSTLTFNGTGTHSISGSFTAQSIRVKTGTINLTSAVTLIESITVESGATFNASAAALTLESNSSGTARVGISGGTFGGTNYIVKTFIPGGSTGWTTMGVRGVTGQLVSDWDTYVSSSAANGIPMACVGCAYGTTVGSGTFCSIQDYVTSSDTYNELTSGSSINPGIGHWVYVGDSQTSTGGLTLINTGALVFGTKNVAVSSGGTGNGYNLIANPYPSPISYTSFFADFTNGSLIFNNPTFFTWNPDIGISGAFTSFNSGGTSPGGAGSLSDNIAGGQGFYVQADVSGSVVFDETMKVDNSVVTNPLLKQTSVNNQTFRLKIAGGSDWDATLFRITSNALSTKDKLDAIKMFQSPGYVGYSGPYTKYTTISSKDDNGVDYSINSLPLLTNSLSVPILAKVSATGTYTISAYDFVNFPMCVTIIDKLNNTYHDLRQSPYVFTISDTTSAPRFEVIMCRDEAVNPTGINEVAAANGNIQINQDQTGAFVTTKFDKATKATISVYNIMGQQLIKDMIVTGTETNTHLNLDLHEQVVLIKVTTDKESTVKKIILH